MRTNFVLSFFCASLIFSSLAQAAEYPNCNNLPNHQTFLAALKAARAENNGGLNHDIWGAMVDRSGKVCAVAFTGAEPGDQWPGSRLIAAQKANTANAFSLNTMALSTANLYSAVQPGASLFGLQSSNPVNVFEVYKGDFANFGGSSDPLVGIVVGGVNVFGGGLALYNQSGRVVGAIGVSGDTSCADHNVAWRARKTLVLDFVPAGVARGKNDQIIYDVKAGGSPSGYGHPTCGGQEPQIAATLPATSPVASPVVAPVATP